MAVTRVTTLGDGHVWSEHATATTYAANGEARTVHRVGGEIIAWDAEMRSPRTIIRTNASIDFAIWVDEQTVLCALGDESHRMVKIMLRSIDEPEPRWVVNFPNVVTKLSLLPDKTMFWVRESGGKEEIRSMEDGSVLEEHHWQWVALGRFAKYRCVLAKHSGAVLGYHTEPDGYVAEDCAPDTMSWHLECDGKKLLEYTGDEIPGRAWIADDDSCVTFKLGDRFETRLLPSLEAVRKLAPLPAIERAMKLAETPPPNLPKPQRVSLADVAAVVQVQQEIDSLVTLSNGDEVRLARGGSSATRYIPRRAGSGGNHVIAFASSGGKSDGGEILALVAERTVHAEPFLNEWPIGPTTRDLRLFALSFDRPEPHLIRVLARRDYRDVQNTKPLLAVSRDGTFAADAVVEGSTVSVWNLETGMHMDTIALGGPTTTDEGGVTALAFGADGRLYVETSRSRVFGYEL